MPLLRSVLLPMSLVSVVLACAHAVAVPPAPPERACSAPPAATVAASGDAAVLDTQPAPPFAAKPGAGGIGTVVPF